MIPDEISAEDRDAGMALIMAMPPERVAAWMSGIIAAVQSARIGECAGCDCDVCVSFRGLHDGMELMVP